MVICDRRDFQPYRKSYRLSCLDWPAVGQVFESLTLLNGGDIPMARSRSISVILRAEVSDFNRQMGSASRTLSEFEKAQTQMGGAATTTMGRLVQNAQINRQEWESVGRTLATTGAAVTAIGGAALKVGINYNSLRQTATQALTAVTGSTHAAGEQMRKLDEYGKNSWLMRDTLVRAQTHMTGFGIEVEKVIPYMDGLAEAVAAAGGSNQDFEELARIMGQIQSQGKITARELNQFGIRGIDAAEMIGVAMGKTAGEIREQITSGALDAGAALDALAEGMKTTWDGSSDLIRDSFEGSLARVKAAFRDLMAEFAKPLVNPEGGGFLVGLNNALADLMRLLEKMPQSWKNSISGVGALAGGLALATGAVMLALPRYIAFRESLETLANSSSKLSGALKNAKATIGPLSAALAGAVIVMELAEAAGNKLEDSLFGVATGTEEATGAILADLGRESGIAAGSVEKLAGIMDSLEGGLAKTNTGLRNVAKWTMPLSGLLPDPFKKAQEEVKVFDGALADLVRSGHTQEAEEWAGRLGEKLRAAGWSTEQITDALPQYKASLQEVTNEQQLATESTFELASISERLGDAFRNAKRVIVEEINDAGKAFIGLNDAYQSVIDKNMEVAKAAAEATGDASKSWEDFYDGHSVSTQDFIKELEKQVEAQREWRSNMTDVAIRAWKEMEGEAQTATALMLQEVARMGPEGAHLMQLFADMTTEELEKTATLWYEKGRKGGLSIRDGVLSAPIPKIPIRISERAALTDMRGLLQKLSGRTVTVAVKSVMSRIPLPFADGGHVPYGMGGPREDNVPAMLSSGEFVVNEAATRKHRAILEAINQDRVPGFADGGPVASSWGVSPTLSIPAPVMSAPVAPSTQVSGHTINVYGVETDATSEVAKAVLFASRKRDRGGVYARRG